MGLREDVVNAFARMMGVDAPLGKASKAAPPPTAVQTANELPAAWQTSTYAPGWPIQPIERPEDVLIPREIDYPLSVNATLQPRTAYGLMPFAALKEAYETVAEIRLPVSTLLREISIFRPHLVDENNGEILDHPFEWLTKSPDRVTSWDVWLTRFLKSSLIFDAGAFFYQYDHADLNAIRYVDGSTLFIMVDENGQVPKPTDMSKDPEVLKKYEQKKMEWLRKGKTIPKTTPAYAQVIKGTPFGWYDASQIWYKPRSRRFDAPYGETTIEQAWAWILICANITGFELAHYREGNMPEGWVNAPDGWSLERIAAFETAFNQRMSSGATERMRTRFFPSGMTWTATKKPEFPKELYTQAQDMISLFFGVPPSEYGRTPGAGLGGKGFEDAMQSSLFRMGLFPLKVYIEGALNEVLERSGVDDAYFDLAFPTDETDPEKHKQSIIELFSNGLITFNAALSALGQDRIQGGDVHLILEYGSIQILEDFLAGSKPPPGERGTIGEPAHPEFVPGKDVADLEGNAQPPDEGDEPFTGNENGKKPPKPPKGGGGNGTNRPPAELAPQRKEKMSKADYELAERMIATRSLNPDGKYISIPQTVKVHGFEKGGAGSGNFGHAGRIGERGGSGGGSLGGGIGISGAALVGNTFVGKTPVYQLTGNADKFFDKVSESNVMVAIRGDHQGTILASDGFTTHQEVLEAFTKDEQATPTEIDNWVRTAYDNGTMEVDPNLAGEWLDPEDSRDNFYSAMRRINANIRSAKGFLREAGYTREYEVNETAFDFGKLAKQGVDQPHIPAHPRDAKWRFASKGRLSDDVVKELLAAAGFETANVSLDDCYAMVDALMNTGLEKGGPGSGNFGHSGGSGGPGNPGGSGGGGLGGGGFNFEEQASMGVYATKKGNVVYDPVDQMDYEHPEEHVAGEDKATDTLSLAQLRQLPPDRTITVKHYGRQRGGVRRSTIKVGQLVLQEKDLPDNVEKLAKAAGDTGVMVALDMPDAVAKQLQAACKPLLPEGAEMLPVSEMHITLFYPGQMQKFEKGGPGSGNFGHAGGAGGPGNPGGSGGGSLGGGGARPVRDNIATLENKLAELMGEKPSVFFDRAKLIQTASKLDPQAKAKLMSVGDEYLREQDRLDRASGILADDLREYHNTNNPENFKTVISDAAGDPYFQEAAQQTLDGLKYDDNGNITLYRGGTVNPSKPQSWSTEKAWAERFAAYGFGSGSGATYKPGETTVHEQIFSRDSLLVALPWEGEVVVGKSGVKKFAKFEDETVEFTEAQLLDAVKDFARTHAPLAGVIGGVARFNGDGGDTNPIVALFDCADLPQFRQDLVEHLHKVGVREGELDVNHGFIPHITLAYIPTEASMKDELKVDPIPLTFKELSVVWGSKWHYVPLLASRNIQKIAAGELAKHCGVCEDDDAYYGAPVSRAPEVDGNEAVYMQPEDLPARVGYWKPTGSEADDVNVLLGGPQYKREEAAYLVDRSMSFFLTPVSYVTEVDDEPGAVVHYTANAQLAQRAESYGAAWVEKAGVLDYVIGHISRTDWDTHPDDANRPILRKNGMSFGELPCASPFTEAVIGKQLSPETLRALKICVNDAATWSDVEKLVGGIASSLAYQRADAVLKAGAVPEVERKATIEPLKELTVDDDPSIINPNRYFSEQEMRDYGYIKKDVKEHDKGE